MKEKFQFTLTSIVEIAPEPENYPPGLTHQEMLKMDLDRISQNPFKFFDKMSAQTLVRGKIVDSSEPANVFGSLDQK